MSKFAKLLLPLALLATVACEQQRPPRNTVAQVAEPPVPTAAAPNSQPAANETTTKSGRPAAGQLAAVAHVVQPIARQQLRRERRAARAGRPGAAVAAHQSRVTTTLQSAKIAALTSLQSFLASGLPAAQEFVVRPQRDTLLIGRQGTQLLVPADAWETAADGPVRLQVQEYYQLADIVLAGLSTTADGRLLETAGMLKLTASRADRTPVALRPTAALNLRMPTTEIKDGMQLFWGDTTGQHGPNWVLGQRNASPEEVVENIVVTKADLRRKYRFDRTRAPKSRWPAFATGHAKLQRELQRGIRYPAVVLAQLEKERHPSEQERNALKAYNYWLHKRFDKARRLAEIQFTVDTTGQTVEVKMCPGYDAELAAPLLATVQALPRWLPAQIGRLETSRAGKQQVRWRTAPTVGKLRIIITKTGSLRYTPSWDSRATNKLRAAIAEQQLVARRMAAYKARIAASRAWRDSLVQAGGQLSAEAQDKFTSEALYYELGNIGLGWINCDRFIGSAQPLITVQIQPLAPETRAVLVLRNSRSIVSGYADAPGGATSFGRLPEGATATLIALRWQQGRAQLAMQDITLAAQMPAPALSYQPVTMIELQTALTKLE